MKANKKATPAHQPSDVFNSVMNVPDEFRNSLETYFNESPGSAVWKLQNFTKYVPRQSLTHFLCRAEMFQKVLNVQGSVVEAGVLGGGGLFAWAQLSAIFEPLNYQRKVMGFDTFEGFPSLAPEDASGESSFSYEGGLALGYDGNEDLVRATKVFDANRFLGRLPKVVLVKGDINKTVPEYLKANPETVVSLLYIDVDVYEPTKTLLEHFLPRMPKGAILAFDELNDRGWPGETIATLETVGIRNLRVQRFQYDTKMSYAVLD